MNVGVVAGITLDLLFVMAVVLYVVVRYNTKKAVHYAVTLKQNEGAFIGLRIKRRWDYWVFVDVTITPMRPGDPVVQAAPGELYVPYRNILYYQEIANVDK